MRTAIMREIIPLTRNDCFTIFYRTKDRFDFPLHFHEELELNLILRARGAQRIIGDHIGEIGDAELVLAGPNLPHGWFTHRCASKNITEVTVQFHRDLFDENFLGRNQMVFLRELLEQSERGLLFTREAALRMAPRLKAMARGEGFTSVLALMQVLHELSLTKGRRLLSSPGFHVPDGGLRFHSHRVEHVLRHMHAHFAEDLSLEAVAGIASMSAVAFSRFFKQKTGKTFIDTLHDIRLGHASRMLIDSSDSISEVAFKCGFNNLSHFNRLFRKKKHCTPKAFRSTYSSTGVRTFV
jgi:AraC-like DNA-binding protein